jgi:Zn-dependent protease with chaperone function
MTRTTTQAREDRRAARLRLVKSDRPRAIDRFIDYFGEPAPAGAPARRPGPAELSDPDRRPGERPGRRSLPRAVAAAGLATALLSGCTVGTSSPSPSPAPRAERPQPAAAKTVDARQAERLRRLMVPILQAADKAYPLDKVRVGIVADPQINAANAGGGQFYVTTGLLDKAPDAQLQAILAHEVAHDDLGHVAQAKVLGAGLNIGIAILDAIVPGSGAITPVAGQLIARGYSRGDEYEADRHGAELLHRIGRPREQMIQALAWLMQQSDSKGGGGFFATHPATNDRIEALRAAGGR